MDFKILECKALDEKVYIYTHKSGLKIYIAPKKGFAGKCAYFAANYGSMDVFYEKDGKTYIEEIFVNDDFVEIISPDGNDIMFPAFLFDGETKTDIKHTENSVTVSYKGHTARYLSSGKITDLKQEYANRNGHYMAFLAKGNLKIEMQ